MSIRPVAPAGLARRRASPLGGVAIGAIVWFASAWPVAALALPVSAALALTNVGERATDDRGAPRTAPAPTAPGAAVPQHNKSEQPPAQAPGRPGR